MSENQEIPSFLSTVDETIYFAVGFKSSNVTRTSGTSGEWYEWTERSRNAITWRYFNRKSMERIVQTLREASMTTGNRVKRWRKEDILSEIYFARNFNKFGRYVSLIM